MNRRGFLKMAGWSVVAGVAGKAAYSTVAGGAEKTGKRWAMVIDLKKLKDNPQDYTNTVNACKLAHNIPSIEKAEWSVNWIWKEEFHYAFIEQENHYVPETITQTPVLLLCNHCDNPPCTNVCPTGATWKREDGIVMMDWHRCVGCRYCMAACPYGSRSFNWIEPREHIKTRTDTFPARTMGVVEKCTFCEERLARGKNPACVDACESRALVFGDLNDPNSEVRKVLRGAYSIRRKPELGTQPEVFYLISECAK